MLTEVKLNRWWEGGIGQHWDDGEGCVTIHERKVRVAYMSMTDLNAAIFAWFCALSDRPPSLWWLTTRSHHDAVGVNCEKRATTDIKMQVPITVYGQRGECWIIVRELSEFPP